MILVVLISNRRFNDVGFNKECESIDRMIENIQYVAMQQTKFDQRVILFY